MDVSGDYGLIQKIKDIADIVDVIGEVVSLKRSGRRYSGLCPFHREKTPSFFVDPDSRFFYCFGCGSGGDVIKFVMAYRNVSFQEALKYLADRYNIEIGEPTHHKHSNRKKEDLFYLLSAAEDFYYGQLCYSKEGAVAREYLKNRGISDKIVKEQKLGYAPPGRHALVRYFSDKGLDVKRGLEAGLFSGAEGAFFDRFRNRLIFPIRNERGQVIAFGGRILGDGKTSPQVYKEPKYLNSPESKLYRKRAFLYQFDKAQEACRKEIRQVLLVEGYMDALAFHNKGFYRVVATLGTSFTPQQARLLSRIADEVVLVYDGDDAGQKAMARIFPFLIQEGIRSSCVVLPNGMDPDDFLRSHSLQDFQELLDSRQDLGRFVVEWFLKGWDGTSVGKLKTLGNMFPYINHITNPVLFSEYVSLLSDRLGLPEDAIVKQFRSWKNKSPILSNEKDKPVGGIANECPRDHHPLGAPLEEGIVRILAKYPSLADQVFEDSRFCSCFLENEEVGMSPVREILRVCYEEWSALSDRGGERRSFDVKGVYERIAPSKAGEVLSRLMVERDLYGSDEAALAFLKDYVEALKKQSERLSRYKLNRALEEAEKRGDWEQVKDILCKIRSITR